MVLAVRRRVKRREGATRKEELEEDSNAVVRGPPLFEERLCVDQANKGAWSLVGYLPGLAGEVHDRLDSIFTASDADGDGQLTKAELAGVLGGNKYVEALDASGDGLISLDEFLQYGREVLKERGAKAVNGYTRHLLKKAPQEQLRAVQLRKQATLIFGALDRDGSGSVDRDEIRHFDKRGKFFHKLDQDGDGCVTEEEFVGYVCSLKDQRSAKELDGFLRHLESQCQARITPKGEDLRNQLPIVQRPDLLEQYKHPR